MPVQDDNIPFDDTDSLLAFLKSPPVTNLPLMFRLWYQYPEIWLFHDGKIDRRLLKELDRLVGRILEAEAEKCGLNGCCIYDAACLRGFWFQCYEGEPEGALASWPAFNSDKSYPLTKEERALVSAASETVHRLQVRLNAAAPASRDITAELPLKDAAEKVAKYITEFPGRTADVIAQALGIPHDSVRRIAAKLKRRGFTSRNPGYCPPEHRPAK